MSSHRQIKQQALDFRQIVEQTTDAVVVLRDGQSVYSNAAARKLFLMDERQSLTITDLTLCLQPADSERLQEKVDRILKAQATEERFIVTNRSPESQPIPLEVIVRPLPDPDHSMIQVTLRDISERYTFEKQLMQSEKLSVVGELAAGILHEVRNPLTAIKGFLQLIQREPQTQRKYIDIILSEVEQIEKITGSLLYFTKPDQTLFTTQELQKIARESVLLFENEAMRRNIQVNLTTDGADTYRIRGDRTQLKQVFVNLVKNALEAISENGRITILILSEGDQVCVKISDTGKGIPKELFQKIGQSFFTTKESGTGLGLMVTCHIIKNHRGTMRVESREGEGTTFTVAFPKAKELASGAG